jgi:hypothetical protein
MRENNAMRGPGHRGPLQDSNYLQITTNRSGSATPSLNERRSRLRWHRLENRDEQSAGPPRATGVLEMSAVRDSSWGRCLLVGGSGGGHCGGEDGEEGHPEQDREQAETAADVERPDGDGAARER